MLLSPPVRTSGEPSGAGPSVRTGHTAGPAPTGRRKGRRLLGGLEPPRPLALFGVLLLLSLAVRAPSFARPYWSPDEGYLATEAVALRHGGQLYGDVVDRKPPLVPWLYEACFALCGSGSLWPVRLCAVAAVAVTAFLTARLAVLWLGGWAALPAGVLTVAATAALPAPDAMAATFEVFMLPATAAAVYYGARRRFLAAGLAVAAATLCKQVGLAVLLPVCLQLLAEPGRRPRRAAALAAGLLLPLLGCALLLGPRPFVFWVFLSSGAYSTSPPAPSALAAHAVTGLLRLCLPLAGFAPLLLRPLWRGLRRDGGRGAAGGGVTVLRRPDAGPARGSGRPPGRTVRTVAVAWLLASACGVGAGFHFYGHYFLQLAPPLVLTALAALDAAYRGRGPFPAPAVPGPREGVAFGPGTRGAPARGSAAGGVPGGVGGRRGGCLLSLGVAARMYPQLGLAAREVPPTSVPRKDDAPGRRHPALSGRFRRHTLARTGRSRYAAAAMLCALAVGAVGTAGAFGSRPPELDASRALAAAVDAHSSPGQGVFAWGMHPEVYWLARRPPASRYLTAGMLTNFAGGGSTRRVGRRYAVPGAWPTLRRELAAHPPCLVVDDSAGTPYALSGYPDLGGLLRRDYAPVATTRTATGTARVYRRHTCPG